jgi:hypothetical protein
MGDKKNAKFPTQGEIILFMFNCARMNLQNGYDFLRKRLLHCKENTLDDALLREAEKLFIEKFFCYCLLEKSPNLTW